MRQYHYNQGSSRKTNNYNNYNIRKPTVRNLGSNYNINNNNNSYNKAFEENNKIKKELHQKTNVLNNYNSRKEMKREELNQLQNKKNFTKSNPIANNNRNTGKSNTNLIVSHNDNFNYDPFDDYFNNGISNFVFNDLISNSNIQRINPNFNPGDYEDYYQDNNINNLIGVPINNNINNNDKSKVEQDIIAQLYPDPDKMTYEQLLELEEKVGSVSKGLTKRQIKKIPKVIYNKIKFKNDDNKCVVCQYEFKNGENVTQLTCGHLFHTECVDTWLSKNKVCPMCHKEIIIK